MIDLARVASHAAIALDDVYLGREPYKLEAIRELAQDIRDRPLRQSNPTTLLLYRDAIDPDKQIKRIDELRYHLTLLAKDLETYQTCSPQQQAVLRDTAVAISKVAMSLKHHRGFRCGFAA